MALTTALPLTKAFTADGQSDWFQYVHASGNRLALMIVKGATFGSGTINLEWSDDEGETFHVYDTGITTQVGKFYEAVPSGVVRLDLSGSTDPIITAKLIIV